jgi:hypothetical protein
VADGSRDGADETAADDADGVPDGRGEALEPPLVQAAARIAMRTREVLVVLRIGRTSGWGTRESVPVVPVGRSRPDAPKRRREEAWRRFGEGPRR